MLAARRARSPCQSNAGTEPLQENCGAPRPAAAAEAQLGGWSGARLPRAVAIPGCNGDLGLLTATCNEDGSQLPGSKANPARPRQSQAHSPENHLCMPTFPTTDQVLVGPERVSGTKEMLSSVRKWAALVCTCLLSPGRRAGRAPWVHSTRGRLRAAPICGRALALEQHFALPLTRSGSGLASSTSSCTYLFLLPGDVCAAEGAAQVCPGRGRLVSGLYCPLALGGPQLSLRRKIHVLQPSDQIPPKYLSAPGAVQTSKLGRHFVYLTCPRKPALTHEVCIPGMPRRPRQHRYSYTNVR